MIRAALFDLDGTLVVTKIDFAGMKRDVIAAAAAHGVDAAPWSKDDSLAIVAHVTQALADRAAPFRAQAFDAIVRHELDSLARAFAPEGVADTLDWLRARGVRVAIVTRNGRDAVGRLLARFALHHDALLTRDDVARVKPDPAHLRDALARLGVDRRHAIMVGDHALDVVAARAANVAHAIGIAHDEEDARALHDAKADAVVRTFAELRAWIDRRSLPIPSPPAGRGTGGAG